MATATPPPGTDDRPITPPEPGRADRRRGLAWFAAVLGGGSLAGGLAVFLGLMLLLSTITWEGCEYDPSGLEDIDIDIGPGKGTKSQRLPVTIEPRRGLTDGQPVFVASTAFPPETVVGVAVCLREADVKAKGVDACDTSSGARFATDPDGALAVAFPVPRVITVGERRYDCAAEADRCLVVAASAADYDASGGQAVTFAPDFRPVDLTPIAPTDLTPAEPKTQLLPGTVSPSDPVAAGSRVLVTASGFLPGEPLLVATCTSDFLNKDAWEACGSDRADIAFGALLGDVSKVPDHADADGTFTTTVEVPQEIEPYLPRRVPSSTDCAVRAWRCGVVIAAAADFSRSAFLPLMVE